MEKIQVIETVLCPPGITVNCNHARSAVNAIAIVTGKSWQEIVKNLVEQSHKRVNLPTYHTCITDVLRENGFMPLGNQFYSISKLMEEADLLNDKAKFIVKTSCRGYFALIPNEGDEYVIRGHKAGFPTYISNCAIDEAWLYREGMDFKTGIYKKSKKHREEPKDVGKLKFENMNPEDKYIGDCVIRGLSAAYKCTWHEAIDYIAQANNYTDPVLNITPNINLALLKLGFERHREIKRGNKLLTGKQFCDLMNHSYHDGERIFAYVGKSHCAAILPFEENGSTVYKIQDTWDSTSRTIREYWVYKEKKPTQTRTRFAQITSLNINDIVTHPHFGKGTIVSEQKSGASRILEIDFENSILFFNL